MGAPVAPAGLSGFVPAQRNAGARGHPHRPANDRHVLRPAGGDTAVLQNAGDRHAVALIAALPLFGFAQTRADADMESAPANFARPVLCAKPVWPAKSLRKEESGVVQMRFLVDVDGTVVESKVTRSSGSRDLDFAARDALSKCRFNPLLVDGVPVKDWMPLTYVWTLE